MKLKSRFVWSAAAISCLLLTLRYAYISLVIPYEKFVPFPEEVNRNEREFVDLENFSSLTHITANTSLMHFLEGYGHSSLTPRMWCAVEAAARVNPNALIVVHLVSPRLLLTPVAEAVTNQAPNLRLVTLDIEKLFSESPLKSWYDESRWLESFWPLSHYNDALRWLILYAYGGIYMDLDSLSVRSITPPEFPYRDFTGLESDRWAGAGVIGVSEKFHWLPMLCLFSMANNFDVSEWGTNGPKLLSRVLQTRCGLKVPNPETPRCPTFKVMQPYSFYPLPWWDYERFMEPDDTKVLASELLSNSSVRVIHLWQHLTKDYDIRLTSRLKTTQQENENKSGSRKITGIDTNDEPDGGEEPPMVPQERFDRSDQQKLDEPSAGDKSSNGATKGPKFSLWKWMKRGDRRDVSDHPQPVAEIVRSACPVTVAKAGDTL